MFGRSKALAFAVALTACGASISSQSPAFTVTELANFDVPWAMEFLPDGRLLVSELRGALKLYAPGGAITEVRGVPEVSYGGQGGFSEVVLHPNFADNGLVYMSYAEAGDGDTRGAAVARAKLALDGSGGELTDLQVIWRQVPK
ncbi:MAG TPA: PQQ-dependent sugar dehydrogenase, partial [Gammaproteobacteria bacterium]|nr:PQQ-dependent sugar dehydrogenase [Gammaproteobacteria bacterium]